MITSNESVMVSMERETAVLSSKMWYLLCYLCVYAWTAEVCRLFLCLQGLQLSMLLSTFSYQACYVSVCAVSAPSRSLLLLFENMVFCVSIWIFKAQHPKLCFLTGHAGRGSTSFSWPLHSLASDPLLNSAVRLLIGVPSSQDHCSLL